MLRCPSLVPIGYWIYDFDDNFYGEDFDLQVDESDNVNVETKMKETKECYFLMEESNPNLVEISFFSSSILDLIDLDSFISYDMVNKNFNFAEILILSYGSECYDRDENSKIAFDEIENFKEERDPVDIEKH